MQGGCLEVIKNSLVKTGFCLFLLVAVIGVALTGCAGVIKGTVTDRTTGHPLEGAEITMEPKTKVAPTDSEGNYKMSDIEPGNYLLKASKDGYRPSTKIVDVQTGEDTTAHIKLSPLDYTQAINDFIKSLGRIVQDEPTRRPISQGSPTIDESNPDSDYTCRVENFKESKSFDLLVALDPITDVIWPGSLIQGRTIRSGEFAPISQERAPMTISISLENIRGHKSKTIDNPKLSSVREAIGEILSENVTGATPAKIGFELEEVHSSEQLGLAIGAGVSWPGVPSVNAQFDFENNSVKSRILVKFTQVYYTIDVDAPISPASLFRETVSPQDLQKGMAGDNPPMYVATVSYGRQVLFTIESNRDSQETKSAIEVAYKGATNVRASTAVSTQKILNDAKITALIYGGSGEDAVKTINGFQGLKEFIERGGNYSKDSPGALISYKLRYLADNTIGNVVLSSDYLVRNCVRISQKVKVTIKRLTYLGRNFNGINLFGALGIDGYNPDGTKAPEGDTIWSLERNRSVRLKPDEPFTINSDRVLTFSNLDPERSYIKLYGSIKEARLLRDSYLGYEEKKLYLKEGWTGEYKLEGFVNGDTRVEAVFTIEPF